MADKLSRIKAIGFKRVGHWKVVDTGIVFDLDKNLAVASNVLYAFAVDGELMYVGKTTISLHHRMQRYKTPPKSPMKGGSTNVKNNRNIRESVGLGRLRSVEIFALDHGLQFLQYGEFHVNFAAALEDSLVEALAPPWNGSKKGTSP